ncbi:SusC/RagA family TonB-linked outer membrane protein [Pseudochryseolinea flava]|uniref:SusC/RagA family TonB-linked outer membrane protein n=1 Tax=Pseudochryseolinea flava TaxID=2059302 RepID=A0A364Y7E6_9BACT|nr:TonB-dependent receptor [Pseudochryseolinea flava]RAW02317.1 SusC/RagA family TonB-linked outer membrane protein [Pseudochryseolinea flava]
MLKNLLRLGCFLLLTCVTAQAQKVVNGKVQDETGAGLPGAAVLLKGGSTGTVSDADGNFTISIPDNVKDAVLVFSSIGFSQHEEVVGDRTSISVSLVPDIQTLGEIVVVGYGTMRREDISGSVTSISTKELPQVANTSVDQLLTGRVPGLNVSQRSAQPGGGLQINVRNAISPLGNNSPLYVIDGVPIFNNASAERSLSDGKIGFSGGVDRNPLNAINPSDIESIDILKDASATAIYGANAANGVILITTKRGKKGAPKIEYRGSYTVQTPKKYIEVFQAKEFMQEHNRLAHDLYLLNNNLAPYGNTDPNSVAAFAPTFSESEIQASGNGTDWLDMLMRNGKINEHNLSISSGNDNSQLYVALNYFNNKGILENSDFTRYTARVNFDQRIGSRVNFKLNVTGSQIDNSNVTSGANSGGVEKYNMLQSAFAFSPTRSVYDDNGRFTKTFDTQITNPAAFLIMDDNATTTRVIITPTVEVKILEHLKLTALVGADRQNAQRDFYLPRAAQNFQLPNGMAQKSNSNISNYIAESYLTFSKTINKSAFDIVAGFGIYRTATNLMEVEAVDFPTDAFGGDNLGAARDLTQTSLGSWRTERKRLSQFFRINYSFNDRYILTLTGRNDGDSYFAENKKYGFFPGASVAWKISNEGFMAGAAVVSDLKLRAGFGQTGNATVSGSALSLYGGNYPYPIGNILYGGVALTQLANPNLTWETNETINVGLDFGILSNRISGSLDVYRRSAKDLLAYTNLPLNNDVSRLLINSGTTRSEGVELLINSNNLEGALSWNTTFNASTSRSEWVEGNPWASVNPWINDGDPYTAIYGWKTDGIIQSTEEIPSYMPNAKPGNIKYLDDNGDGVLDSKDIVLLGQSAPKWNFGLANTFRYKNFDLNLFVYAYTGNVASTNSIGQGFDPATPGRRLALSNIQNVPVQIRDVWTYDRPIGTLPGVAPDAYSGNNPSGANDFYLQKANFIRLRNITLGYNFSDAALAKTFIRSARIFFDVQNVAKITNFDGFDPEILETNPYPQALSTTIGVNLGF